MSSVVQDQAESPEPTITVTCPPGCVVADHERDVCAWPATPEDYIHRGADVFSGLGSRNSRGEIVWYSDEAGSPNRPAVNILIDVSRECANLAELDALITDVRAHEQALIRLRDRYTAALEEYDERHDQQLEATPLPEKTSTEERRSTCPSWCEQEPELCRGEHYRSMATIPASYSEPVVRDFAATLPVVKVSVESSERDATPRMVNLTVFHGDVHHMEANLSPKDARQLGNALIGSADLLES